MTPAPNSNQTTRALVDLVRAEARRLRGLRTGHQEATAGLVRHARRYRRPDPGQQTSTPLRP